MRYIICHLCLKSVYEMKRIIYQIIYCCKRFKIISLTFTILYCNNNLNIKSVFLKVFLTIFYIYSFYRLFIFLPNYIFNTWNTYICSLFNNYNKIKSFIFSSNSSLIKNKINQNLSKPPSHNHKSSLIII